MPDTILNLHGKVPWSASIYYANGRLGMVGICSGSDTREQALSDAKNWLRNHSTMGRGDFYLNPSCQIAIGYRNIFDGSMS